MSDESLAQDSTHAWGDAGIDQEPAPLKRLWTPWRMGYVANTPQSSGQPEVGCVFCQHLASDDDVRSLILHRGRHAFAIMNLYPYNTGHLMLLPNAHVPSPESAPPEALAEMAALLPGFLFALRTSLTCAGFNTGMNIGEVAGAGIASHLHQHVVPRWPGDANFMPVLAATKVLPELLPVTYAKIRAEIAVRLLHQNLKIVALAKDGNRVFTDTANRLPPVVLPPKTGAIWRSVADWLGAAGAGGSRVIGWAEHPAAGVHQLAIVLECQADVPSQTGHRWSPVDSLAPEDQTLVRRFKDFIDPAATIPNR